MTRLNVPVSLSQVKESVYQVSAGWGKNLNFVLISKVSYHGGCLFFKSGFIFKCKNNQAILTDEIQRLLMVFDPDCDQNYKKKYVANKCTKCALFNQITAPNIHIN